MLWLAGDMAAALTAFTDCPDEVVLWEFATAAEACGDADAVGAHVRECSLCAATIAALRSSNRETAETGHAVPVTATLPSEVSAPEPAAPHSPIVASSPETTDAARYVLGRELGRGASAAVYHARDTRLGIELAVKVFRNPSSTNWLQELLLARNISHPNVCRVYDACVVDGDVYLAMEYVDGATLQSVQADRHIASDEAVRILTQLAEGLRAAHAARVVHRDLKPQNVLLTPAGRVVLSDFGLARSADHAESRARLLGTPAYWAPEQARGEAATFASDVYSFGVMAYQLLSGAAYQLSDATALMRVAENYRGFVTRCLEAAPSQRFASAMEMSVAFSEAQRAPMLADPRTEFLSNKQLDAATSVMGDIVPPTSTPQGTALRGRLGPRIALCLALAMGAITAVAAIRSMSSTNAAARPQPPALAAPIEASVATKPPPVATADPPDAPDLPHSNSTKLPHALAPSRPVAVAASPLSNIHPDRARALATAAGIAPAQVPAGPAPSGPLAAATSLLYKE
jgi:serine/threonine protein kinase